MFDIHTHILPGLDDGPKGWDETLKMCRLARADGIKGLVATPHVRDGLYPNRREVIVERVKELRERIKDSLDIEVFWGSDAYITTDIADKIKKGEITTINDRGYLLLELPYHILPPQIERVLFDLKLMKITPILTHIERSYWIQKGFQQIRRFIEMGALIQITALSLTGGFGKRVSYLTVELIKHELAHIIASDCHRVNLRPPGLSSAFKIASEIIGEDAVRAMVEEKPLKIIEGREL